MRTGCGGRPSPRPQKKSGAAQSRQSGQHGGGELQHPTGVGATCSPISSASSPKVSWKMYFSPFPFVVMALNKEEGLKEASPSLQERTTPLFCSTKKDST